MGTKWSSRFQALLRRPAVERRWLLPAWLMLGLGRVLVLLTNFRWLAARLGIDQGAAPWTPLASYSEQALALHLGRAIRTAARYTPWESNCFAQAVAARILLGAHRLPFAIYFGVARDAGSAGLEAHAWVTTGRVNVTGGYGFARYTILACFAKPSGRFPSGQ